MKSDSFFTLEYLIVTCKPYNVSLKCCESTRHILHRWIDSYCKKDKLLHWCVSITGLSKKSQQVCDGAGERRESSSRASNSCQQLPFHGCLLWGGSSHYGLREEQPWEPVAVAAPAAAHRSSLRVLLITAIEAREPVLLSKVH